ncbi:T9SS type A sorting domain-containing protein [Aequorivita capsosiphonis]|uniref:T9SS type A sorting domain-containing protein n=1 Tax=Aequorivita capsosiphonis TaxID=487317 RepID=UPI000418706D|nr:T9SS type A sorting domain-containing protein [Aequorivita capsosiphonis]
MKKPLLFLALLLTSAVAFAQLSVRPTPGPSSTDSYIYVKDQILYVKNEINLEKNSAGDEEASVYLRNGGQLIQGGTTSTNTGDGFLSVQQNSPVTNAFAYYDWCSPVGNPTIATSGNTNFGLGSIYEDQNGSTPGEGTKAILSANIPGRDGFSSPLTISRRWLYILTTPGTEAEANYQRINASPGASPGFGFTMKGVNKGTEASNDPEAALDQIYEFRGRPNSGDFVIPVDGPSVGQDAKMTLSGNPYPSALDMQQVFSDTDNVALNSIFYYDEDRSVMSHYYSDKPFGYGVWIKGSGGNGSFTKATFYIWKADGTHGGDPGTPSVRPNNPGQYAPIGQGFRLVGNSSGTVTIKNSHRVFEKEGSNSVFYRPTAVSTNDEEANINDPNADISAEYEVEDTRTPQLRLYVVFDSALTRDMLLLFSDETTDGYDRGYDGLSPAGMKSDVFFPISGADGVKLPYVIQGTNYNEDKQIPITLKLHQPSHVDFRAVEEINKPYQRAYLFDNYENTYTLLHRGNLSAGMTLPAGVYEDRFYIVFRNPNLRSDVPETQLLANEAAKKNVNFFQNNPAKQLEIRNPEGYTLKSAEVYDMAGKLVINERNLGDNTTYSFYTGNLSDGVYLVKLTTSENITLDYKAIVHNK